MRHNNMLTAKYAKAIWAMQPEALDAFFELLASFDETALVTMTAELQSETLPPGLIVSDNVAHIDVKGPILKERDWVLDFFGVEHAASMDIEHQLKAAAQNPDVHSVMLNIESPGGDINGLAEVVDAMEAVKTVKPVNAHGQDLIASAAYWIGSHADKLTANKMAKVGAIGVYTVEHDFSGMFAEAGIKTHVISSHVLKGAGVRGTEVTEAQLADTQRLIDTITDHFVGTVAEGRGMSVESAKELATGQVWLADEAMSKGLLDGVISIEGAHQSATEPQIAATHSAAQRNSVPLGTEEKDPMRMHIPAPVAADGGPSDTAELDSLRAENEALKAANEAQETALAATVAGQKEALIKQAQTDGRITPLMMGSVEKMADKCDVATLDSFLATLPPQVHVDVASVIPVPLDPNSTDHPSGLSASDRIVKAVFGVDAKWIKATELVESIDCKGDFILKDGTVKTKAELLEMV